MGSPLKVKEVVLHRGDQTGGEIAEMLEGMIEDGRCAGQVVRAILDIPILKGGKYFNEE